MPEPTDQELLGFLDESLSVDRMTVLENAIRESESLRKRLATLRLGRSEADCSVAVVWRSQRLSCLTRAQWSSHLLGLLPDDLADYAEFHLRVIGCRFCAANLADLRSAK